MEEGRQGICYFFQILDSRGLNIQDVVAVDSGEHLKYTLGDAHPAFGSPLTVHLPTSLSADRLLPNKCLVLNASVCHIDIL